MKVPFFKAAKIPNSSRLAARGTLQLMLGRACLLGTGYLVAIILARGLGPLEYGLYGIILSLLVWIERIGRFGIPEAISKLSPEDEERRVSLERTSFTLFLTVFLALFILSWLAAPALSRLFEIPDGAGLFRLAILDVPVSGIYFLYEGILIGRRNFASVSGGLAAYGVSKLTGILIAVFLGLSIFWALIVNILATVGALLYLSLYVSPSTLRFSTAHFTTIFSLALPVGLYLLGKQILTNLDLWSLKILGNEQGAIIGNYVAALNIARIPVLMFAVVNGVVLPSISRALAVQDNDLARRYVQGAGRFLWVTLLPACVLLSLTAEELMVFLYSDSYSSGGSFLAFQLFGFALLGVDLVFAEMLVAAGGAYLPVKITLSLLPVALVANGVLIPYFGAMGAASAAAVAGLSNALVSGFFVYRRFGSIMESPTFFKVIFATAVAAFVSTQIPVAGLWLVAKYLVLLTVYGSALVLFGELTWEDARPFALWRNEQA